MSQVSSVFSNPPKYVDIKGDDVKRYFGTFGLETINKMKELLEDYNKTYKKNLHLVGSKSLLSRGGLASMNKKIEWAISNSEDVEVETLRELFSNHFCYIEWYPEVGKKINGSIIMVSLKETERPIVARIAQEGIWPDQI